MYPQTAESDFEPKDTVSLHGKIVTPLLGAGAALSEWSQNMQLKMVASWPIIKERVPTRYVKIIAGGILASVAAIYLWKVYRRCTASSRDEVCKNKETVSKGTSTLSKAENPRHGEKRQGPRSPTTRVADICTAGGAVAPENNNVCKNEAAGELLGEKGSEDSPGGQGDSVNPSTRGGRAHDPSSGDSVTVHYPAAPDSLRGETTKRLSLETEEQMMLKTMAKAAVSPAPIPGLLCSIQESRVTCLSTATACTSQTSCMCAAHGTPQHLLLPCAASGIKAPSAVSDSVSLVQNANTQRPPQALPHSLWSATSKQTDAVSTSSIQHTLPGAGSPLAIGNDDRNQSHKTPLAASANSVDPECDLTSRDSSADPEGNGCENVGQDANRPQVPQPLAQVAYAAAAEQRVGFHSLCALTEVQCTPHPVAPLVSVSGAQLNSSQNPMFNVDQQHVSHELPACRRQVDVAASSRILTPYDASSAATCALCTQTLHVHSPSVHVYSLPHHGSAASAAHVHCLACSSHLPHHCHPHVNTPLPQSPLLHHHHHHHRHHLRQPPPQHFVLPTSPQEQHYGDLTGPLRPAPFEQYMDPELFPAAPTDVLQSQYQQLAGDACHLRPASGVVATAASMSDCARTRGSEHGSQADVLQQALILWRPARLGVRSPPRPLPAADHMYSSPACLQTLLAGGLHYDAASGAALSHASPGLVLHHQRPMSTMYAPSAAAAEVYLDGYLSHSGSAATSLGSMGEAIGAHCSSRLIPERSQQFFHY